MSRVLYTFWRSQAAFRVRIALHLKRLEAETVFVNLLQGEQHAEDYRRLNPGMAVPTLLDGDAPPLIQSLAILEYLEETQPEPPLLPRDPRLRAHARAVAQMVAVDAHPLIVPRVRHYLERELGLDETARTRWLQHWLDGATAAVEQLLAGDGRTGRFCVGDDPTMADICLFAHVTSARMLYAFDPAPYPTVARICAACEPLEAFSVTHPLRQPDAPR